MAPDAQTRSAHESAGSYFFGVVAAARGPHAQFRPSALARKSALSASPNSALTDSPWSGQQAKPADIVTFSSKSRGGRASETMSTSLWATRCATTMFVAGAKIANSSPPIRKGVSGDRVWSVRSRPIQWRTTSPVSCP